MEVQGLFGRKLHMTVIYPDGTVFLGKRDLRHVIDHLGLNHIDFSGRSVCDIATDEGFFAFWAEGAGAERILATDVDDFARYDWGFQKDENFIRENNAFRAENGKRVFDIHHDSIGSKVEYVSDSIYDLTPDKHGVFDFVFNFGLIYHLRHPLLSLDRARRICSGVIVLESQINNKYGVDIPLLQFYRTTEHRSPSAWSGLSTACLTHMMKDAGFDHIFHTKLHYPHQHRQVFVGCINEDYGRLFESNPNLTYCGDAYWQRCFEASKVWNGTDWQLEPAKASSGLTAKLKRIAGK
ncbi:MAG: hypothetical protein H6905_04180 [Hyphomicrobiales bacterium]|nr:hypothetical protein [Hyphomicrobiales bacterium]